MPLFLLMRVFLDLDGVLADFNRSVAGAFQLPYPSDDELGHGWMYFKHLKSRMSVDEYLHALADQHDFWRDLDPFPWYRELPDWLDQHSIDWSFLSSTTNSRKCWGGKSDWIQDHYGTDYLKRLILVLGNKHRICRPGDVLVDDCHQNCQEWQAAGGRPYFWREFPAYHPKAQEQLNGLKNFITGYAEQMESNGHQAVS